MPYEFESRPGDVFYSHQDIFMLYFIQVGLQSEQGHVPAVKPEEHLAFLFIKGLHYTL